MFNTERVYPVFFHFLYKNGNHIEAAVGIHVAAQCKVSARSLDDLLLLLQRHRFSRMPFRRRESGFHLNKAECFMVQGNDVNFIPMKPVIALSTLA